MTIGRALLVFTLAACAALPGVSVAAQGTLPELETIEVTEPLHRSLVRLQESWIEWLTAYHAHDPDRASQVLAEIIDTMHGLGMQRLSDLSLGAAASAVQAARASDFERAGWALEAAELLDPSRPENAFAASTIARLDGRRTAALLWHVRGYARLIWFRWESKILLHDVLLWFMIMVILAGALFIALMATTKGPALYRDLAHMLAEKMPSPVADGVSLGLLLFPLVLPSGFVLLLAYWSILLWGYCSRSERTVFVAIWLAMGAVPTLVSQQRQRIEVLLSPPVRAVESLALGRLEGSMLTDLGRLRLMLPESAAVKHLLADVHLQLGQWEFARSLYLDVVDSEPDNAAAELNLGAFYFRVGDHASAIQHFQRASANDDVAAAAFFNLSQTYSASYMFDDSEQILAQARRVDEESVSEWLRSSNYAQVVTVKGGLQRAAEVHTQLLDFWNPPEEAVGFGRRIAGALSIRLAVIVLLLALVFERVCRRMGFFRQRTGRSADDEEPDDSLRRTLVPGMAAALDGRGGQAFAGLVLPVALLTLPLVGTFGYRIPWGYEPGNFFIWAIAAIGLVIYVSSRVVRGLKS